MGKKNTKAAPEGSNQVATNGTQKLSRAMRIAANGISSADEFSNLMSAMMSETIAGVMTPEVCNATCNAGGKLLKVVEMQFKYGTPGPGGKRKVLMLTAGE